MRANIPWHSVLRHSLLPLLCALLLPVSFSGAFIRFSTEVDPWLTTASGTRDGNGEPVILTWSFVPDGTTVHVTDDGLGNNPGFGNLGPSDLISFLDSEFGSGNGGTNLAQRPWFNFFNSSFARFGALGGATYVYEPNDDGSQVGSQPGELGVRGDIRISGANIDGASNVLAFNPFPNIGDMVIDTSDSAFFSDGTNSFRKIRNTIMHEHGHGIGLMHTSNQDLLMNPFIVTGVDGPQLDEVRGIQFFFGDANEQTNGGLGNNTAATATHMGTFARGESTSVGSDANIPSQVIDSSDTDFVSLANLNDTDFYSFEITQSAALSAFLIPRGGFPSNTLPEFDANSRSDLTLAIFDIDGETPLATIDNTAIGETEILVDLFLPEAGVYYAQVLGDTDTIQLYELQISFASTVPLPGDFNADGFVDAADYTVWLKSLGSTGEFLLHANGDGSGFVDQGDYDLWKLNFGSNSNDFQTSSIVPEPASIVSCILLGTFFTCFRSRFNKH